MTLPAVRTARRSEGVVATTGDSPAPQSAGVSPSLIDPKRLARAVHLRTELLPDGRFLVSGGRGPHVVDITGAESGFACNCLDALYRPGGLCKHTLAARLRAGDTDVLNALRAIVPHPDDAKRNPL